MRSLRTLGRRTVLRIAAGLVGLWALACVGDLALRSQGECAPIRQALHSTLCVREWGRMGGVRQSIFTPDSRQLVLTTSTGVMLLPLDAAAPTVTFPYVLPGKPRRSSISPDGALLARTGERGMQMVDTATQQVRYTLPGVDRYGGAVAFSPDGQLFAWSEVQSDVTDLPGQVRLYRAADGTLVQTVPGGYALDRYVDCGCAPPPACAAGQA